MAGKEALQGEREKADIAIVSAVRSAEADAASIPRQKKLYQAKMQEILSGHANMNEALTIRDNLRKAQQKAADSGLKITVANLDRQKFHDSFPGSHVPKPTLTAVQKALRSVNYVVTAPQKLPSFLISEIFYTTGLVKRPEAPEKTLKTLQAKREQAVAQKIERENLGAFIKRFWETSPKAQRADVGYNEKRLSFQKLFKTVEVPDVYSKVQYIAG